jgi:hypothetical protein
MKGEHIMEHRPPDDEHDDMAGDLPDAATSTYPRNSAIEDDISELETQATEFKTAHARSNKALRDFLQAVYTVYYGSEEQLDDIILRLSGGEKLNGVNSRTPKFGKIIRAALGEGAQEHRKSISAWAKCLNILYDEKVLPQQIAGVIEERNGVGNINKSASEKSPRPAAAQDPEPDGPRSSEPELRFASEELIERFRKFQGYRKQRVYDLRVRLLDDGGIEVQKIAARGRIDKDGSGA